MTQEPDGGATAEVEERPGLPFPERDLIVRTYAVVLGGLLLGYMFLGRGFAHIGIGPVYIGDLVLLLGIGVAAYVAIRSGVRQHLTWTIGFLLAFVALGALRTVPYLGTYGLDALRDGVLWGYAGFALIAYLLFDRVVLLRAFRTYGWIVPVFALWLPISWNLFAAASSGIDPSRPGSFVPLVFFKGGDMAVHIVGSVAFLVIGASAVTAARTFLWRTLVCIPLLWTAFVAGTSNRGALVTAAVGIVSIGLIARQWRAWLPLAAATALFVVAMVLPGFLPRAARPAPSTAVEESVTASAASATPALSAAPVASESGPSAGIPAGSGPPLESRLPILNAGFELGAINNGTIYGWSKRPGLTSAPDGTASYNIVEGGAYRGARFASIRNVLKPFQATVTSSRIPFTVGDDIGVSVWVKAIVGRPVLAIYINWFDASGRLISSDRAGSLSTKGALTWQECVGFAKPPAGTAQAQLLLYEGTTTTTMGIDEVTVQRGDFLPEPTPPKGRPATLQQIIDNLLSIFSASPDSGLEGSKQFRLAWWGKIIDYTVFGNYFWTGKGFGVNLADTDGFQSTVDRSLRSPHNSHVTVLARMGIPGFVLWLVLQGTFGIGLLRATIALRRAGDVRLAMTAALVFSYWVAIMVDTSFDPYLEGPQGGIWFWTIFGVGLVIMSIAPRRPVTA